MATMRQICADHARDERTRRGIVVVAIRGTAPGQDYTFAAWPDTAEYEGRSKAKELCYANPEITLHWYVFDHDDKHYIHKAWVLD